MTITPSPSGGYIVQQGDLITYATSRNIALTRILIWLDMARRERENHNVIGGWHICNPAMPSCKVEVSADYPLGGMLEPYDIERDKSL